MFRRFMAYLLDTIIIVLCIQVISSNSFINKDYEKYTEISDEYMELNRKYTEALGEIESIYKDEKVEDDEISKFESKYKEIDFKINKDDKYNDTIKKYNKKYVDFTTEYDYKLSKKNNITNIVTIVLMLLYFGFIEYVFDGQTLGKKIYKLRVDRVDEKEITLWNTMFKAIIITGVLFTFIEVLMVNLMSKKMFMNTDLYVSILGSIIDIACIVTIVFRKDRRGLHELLSGTKVTDLRPQVVIEEVEE